MSSSATEQRKRDRGDILDAFAELVAEKILAKLQERDADAVLNVPDAAKRISRSPGAVRQLVARGEIMAIRCGRRIQIEERELEAWRERNRTA